MAIAANIARGAGLKPSALGGSTVVEQLFGGMLATDSAAGEHVSVDKATTLPAVFRAIRLFSEVGGSLPLVTYERGRDRDRAEDHPSYELLHHEPNPSLSAVEFWTLLLNHFTSWGKIFIGKEFVGGRLHALHPIEPDRMSIERMADGRLEFTESLSNGGQRRLTQRDVIYVRLFTRDGVDGLSPIGLQRETMGFSLAQRKMGAHFFRDAAIPSGALTVEEKITDPETKDRLRAEWKARHQGKRDIAVLDAGAKFNPISIPFKDAQFVELWGATKADIADVFNMPHSLLGAPTGDTFTYGNRESDVRQFLTFTLHNPLKKVEQALSRDRDLFPRPAGRRTHFCEFLREDLLQPDSRARAEFYRHALDPRWGWMRRGEVRQRENLPDDGLMTNDPLGGTD